MTDDDLADLLTIKQKLWQAVATLSTISSTDFRERMRGADSQVRSALEHVERISRRVKAPDEQIEEREDAPLPPDIASDNPDDWAIEAEQTADIGHDTLPICQCAHSKPLHFDNGQCVAVGCGCKRFTFEGTR